ncbi:hypothetical protein [Nocardia sp. BMG111209]|uniref:hypothetical protein n=1 Tax=Nocardia sp. BMG111209 TaxID=1160137 RepID=UPI000365C170|nr:hypothetical protein [Nocardia sp. BMG111209]
MEPISLGIAAAALLASKFGEGFAKDAGESGWNAMKHLRTVIAAKLHGDTEAETAVARLATTPTEADRSAVATRIADAAQADPDFGSEVVRLVSLARRDPVADGFVAQAFDHAKQINIRGDNFGSINL